MRHAQKALNMKEVTGSAAWAQMEGMKEDAVPSRSGSFSPTPNLYFRDIQGSGQP